MRKKFVIIATILIAIDQIVKFFAKNALEFGDDITLIPHILKLSYLENRGAAYGILQGNKFILVGVTSVVIAVLLYYVLAKKITDKF